VKRRVLRGWNRRENPVRQGVAFAQSRPAWAAMINLLIESLKPMGAGVKAALRVSTFVIIPPGLRLRRLANSRSELIAIPERIP